MSCNQKTLEQFNFNRILNRVMLSVIAMVITAIKL